MIFLPVGQMAQFLNYALIGLATGTTYAMVGLGIALVYQVTGVINFAQGDFVMLGGVLFAVLTEHMGTVEAALIALGVTTAVGALINLLVIAPARKATHDRLIILTIGASITVQGAALLAFGPDPHVTARFSSNRTVSVFGALLDSQYLWCAGTTAVAVLSMWLFLTRTTMGTAMRATSMDRETVQLMGVSPRRMALLAFVLAAALGALGGIVLTPLQQFDAMVGVPLGLKGFAAAVLGGLSSPSGAVAGGLLFGLAEAMIAGYIGSTYKDTIGFGLLLAVLLFRPTGLLRRATVVKV